MGDFSTLTNMGEHLLLWEGEKNKERGLQDLMGNHYLNGFALTSIAEKRGRFYRFF